MVRSCDIHTLFHAVTDLHQLKNPSGTVNLSLHRPSASAILLRPILQGRSRDMPHVFRPRANTIAKGILLGTVLLIAGLSVFADGFVRSKYVTKVGVPIPQPVAYSHRTHVGKLGLDCRYCHTAAENSSFAGLPPTETCMNCHSQVLKESPALELVRKSFDEGTSIAWNRVNSLPDYVYFDHSIHLHKGVGCVTCHGQVDAMPVVQKTNPWLMESCLECHRNPEAHLRPLDQVFNMNMKPPADPISTGQQLAIIYGIESPTKLTNCSICHR